MNRREFDAVENANVIRLPISVHAAFADDVAPLLRPRTPGGVAVLLEMRPADCGGAGTPTYDCIVSFGLQFYPASLPLAMRGFRWRKGQ
jgi:hypothetical protein